MASNNQNVSHETTDKTHCTSSTYENSQTGDPSIQGQNVKADKENHKKEIEATKIGDELQDVSPSTPHSVYSNIPHNVSLVSPPVVQNNSAAFHQIFSFSPAFMNFYYSSHGMTPGFNPGYPCSSPLASGCILPSGLPPLPSAPGFLTGAGYHFSNVGSPLIGGLRVPGSSLLHLGQAGTLLHSAAILADKLKLSEVLQDASIDLEARDQWGRVALMYAVMGNHQEAVETLLRAGARPDATDSHNRTPLHFAAYKGHLGCIKAILHAVESKGITNCEGQGGVWLAQDVKGVTPLHHAAIHSNSKCLQVLLKYAAPGTLDTEDHKKRTPLLWAAAYGSEENVRLLIKHGANNLMPDQEGKTPLHWAAMSKAEGAKYCVRTLIAAAPSSINWQDFDGITALHLAVAEAREDTVDGILGVQRCNVDLTDNHFRTALHWACSRGLTTIVGKLLERGAHLGAVDVYGATPLHYAAQLNHADTVELVRRLMFFVLFIMYLMKCLLKYCKLLYISIQMSTSLQGQSPLHWAAQQGHLGAVNTLLDFHAYPNYTQTTDDRYTPLDCAYVAEQLEVAQVLMEAGGLSVTRIMEFAATKIQAVVRSYLTRKRYRLKKSGTNVSDNGNTRNSSNSLVMEIKQTPSTKPIAIAEKASLCHLKGSSLLNSDTKDAQGVLEKQEISLAGKETKTSSLMHHHLRGTLSDSSPYNSVSGQRRSKVLASSIMRGARKKTLRNLELPGLSELGLNQMEPKELPPVEKTSDSEEDSCAVLAHPPQCSSLKVAEALKHYTNIAAAIATAGVAKPNCAQNIGEEINIMKLENRHSDKILTTESSESKTSNDTCNTQSRDSQFLKKISDTVVTNNSENVIKYLHELYEYENGNTDLIKYDRDDHSDCTKYSAMDRLYENAENSFENDSVPALNLLYDNEFEDDMLQRINRRQILEDKAARSLSIAEKQGVGWRTSAGRLNDRYIISAETRKRAEERWNNKLASLTLQGVQQPNSSKSGVSFSYNLVTPAATLSAFTTKMNSHFVNRSGYNAPNAL
nr:poly [ADP-ribose] polymerase tankyrase-2-like [Cherax quadricarinatus]